MINYIGTICVFADRPSDQEYMIWLYEEYQRLMFAVARRYISDNSVEDIVQDCLVQLIQKIDVLRNMKRPILAGYIVSAVRNTSINYLRSGGISQKYEMNISDEAWEDIDNGGIPLEDMLVLAERHEALQNVWTQMPEADKYLLEGKYILGLSDAVLAKQMGCKESSIRMKMTRARRRAMKLMAAWGKDGYLGKT